MYTQLHIAIFSLASVTEKLQVLLSCWLLNIDLVKVVLNNRVAAQEHKTMQIIDS
jgi:hypothetical protein